MEARAWGRLVRERPDNVDVTRLEYLREAFGAPPERHIELRKFVIDHNKHARPQWDCSGIQHGVMPFGRRMMDVGSMMIPDLNMLGTT